MLASGSHVAQLVWHTLSRGFSKAAAQVNAGLPARRALLYVPGSDERKIAKAASQVRPDCVCLDLEDAVAPSKKDEARGTVVRLLGDLDFGGSNVVVRVNGTRTPYAQHDVAALFAAQQLPHGLLLPKLEREEELSWLYEQAVAGMRARTSAGLEGTAPALLTMCETGRGLVDLRDLLRVACAEDAPLRLEACVFGADDYAASVHATRTASNNELVYARQHIVAACHAFGVQPIDLVKTNFLDAEGLRAEALEGAALGFAGKQVIHPAQVPVVHTSFSPSPGEVAEARQLVDAFTQHAQAGRGAFSWNGKMIDMPTVLQAQNVLAMAERARST